MEKEGTLERTLNQAWNKFMIIGISVRGMRWVHNDDDVESFSNEQICVQTTGRFLRHGTSCNSGVSQPIKRG